MEMHDKAIEAARDILMRKSGYMDREIQPVLEKLFKTALELNKKAYWLEDPKMLWQYHCSNCGSLWGVSVRIMRYCPGCGSRMLEIKKEDD